jgi:hypothetical protein
LLFWSLEAAFWSAVLLEALLFEEGTWSAVALLAVAFWSEVVVVVLDGFWAFVLEAAFWSAVVLLDGVLAVEEAAFWSAVLDVVLVLEAAFWSVVDAGGFTGALALLDCAPEGLLVVAAAALLLSLLVEAAVFWSVVLELAVPWAGGLTGALALSPWAGACVVFVVAAGAFALLVSEVGVRALPGAAGGLLLVLEAAFWSVLVELVLEAAFWSVVELLEFTGALALSGCALDGLLVVAAAALLLPLVDEALWSVLLAEAPIDPDAAPELAWLLVQESEIILTELTWREPSLARVPCTWTWCPSWGFRMELSPCRLTVWPLSEERIQLPPDCFKQPLNEPDWSLLVVLVAVEVWLWVWLFASVPAWPWPAPVVALPLVPLPCANAIPEASISARKNFLFMSFAPSKFAPRGFSSFVAGVRW